MLLVVYFDSLHYLNIGFRSVFHHKPTYLMRQQQTSLRVSVQIIHQSLQWCHMSKDLPHREAVVGLKQAKSSATCASDKLMRQ